MGSALIACKSKMKKMIKLGKEKIDKIEIVLEQIEEISKEINENDLNKTKPKTLEIDK